MPVDLHADVVAAKNSIHGEFVFSRMLVLTVNATTTMYLTDRERDVYHDSKTWQAFPFAIGDWEEDDRGNLPDSSLVVADPKGTLGQLLDANPEFMDANIETFLLVNGAAGPSVFWSIEDAIRGDDGTLSFRLGSLDPFYTNKFPRQRIARNRCRHVYKGTRCGYSGAQASCDFSLRGANGCMFHENQARFGGCPGSR